MGMAGSKMTVAFPAPYGTVFDAFARNAAAVKHCSLKRAEPSEGTLDFNVGMSMMSWGESIHVAVYVPPNQQWTYVDLTSQSTFALADWGRNQGNIDKLLNAVAQTAGAWQVIQPATSL